MTNNPTPRDPLLNETLRVPESDRTYSNVAESYRPVYRPNAPERDRYGIQGAFKSYNAQGMLEYEWRDLPTVVLD